MSKRIVICCDGTWNTPDQEDDQGIRCPTNVVKTARAVRPVADDGAVQVVFYDQGVGTHWGLDRVTGGALGKGIDKNIQDAYRFLVNNYAEGDDLYFFGFSRGAYTARSAVGLVRNVGLLHKRYADKIPDAYAIYRSDEGPDGPKATRFREQYSWKVEVPIRFLGVWDTVGALGVPIGALRWMTKGKYEFHDVELSGIVQNAFQALAIDEQRKPFRPAVWKPAVGKTKDHRVEQVWFAGVHSNVGGGYSQCGLSDITFDWMARRAAECDLSLDAKYIEDTVRPSLRGELMNSMTWFYRMAGRYRRPIGQAWPATESVHASAAERLRSNVDPPYRPPNLRDYLDGDDRRIWRETVSEDQ